MSAIFLPRRWRHQPQGAVELGSQFDVAIALLPGWGLVGPLARNGQLAFAHKSVSSPNGRGLSADTGNISANISSINNRTSRLVVAIAANRRGSMRFIRVLGTNGYGWGLAADSWDTNSVRTLLLGSWGGGSIAGDGVDTPVRENQPVGIGVYADMTAGGRDFSVYANGSFAGSKSLGAADPTQSAATGNLRFNYNNNPDGAINMVAVIRNATPEVAEAVSENPWQLFRAPSHRIWFDVGAGSSGTTYNESLTESATLGDSLDPLAAFFSSYAESVTAGDSADNAQTHAATLSESVTPADSAASAQSHAEALAESVTADDSAAPAQTMPVALSEDVTAGDALADEVVPAGSFNETRTESATVADAYASAQAHTEDLSESLGLADSYAVTGGAEVVERRRGAPIGPPLRTWRYAARIGGRMVYADTRQALQAAIADFEVSVPSRAEKKAQKAGKVVVRRLPKVQVVEAPAEERIEVQAQAQAANDRIAAEYLSALQAQIAIRAAMERDDMEAMIALDFL